MELVDLIDRAFTSYPTWKLIVFSVSTGVGGVGGFFLTRTFYGFLYKLVTSVPNSKKDSHSVDDKAIDLQFKYVESLINNLENLIKDKEKLDDKSDRLILEKLEEIKDVVKRVEKSLKDEINPKLDEISDNVKSISWRN